jgi:hypothetical protein
MPCSSAGKQVEASELFLPSPHTSRVPGASSIRTRFLLLVPSPTITSRWHIIPLGGAGGSGSRGSMERAHGRLCNRPCTRPRILSRRGVTALATLLLEEHPRVKVLLSVFWFRVLQTFNCKDCKMCSSHSSPPYTKFSVVVLLCHFAV